MCHVQARTATWKMARTTDEAVNLRTNGMSRFAVTLVIEPALRIHLRNKLVGFSL